MSEQITKKRNSVVAGAMILGFSNLIIKAIGVLFKIPLTNIITEEGMGYFNAAYVIYVWFYIISTAGLPVAISIMISESRAKGRYKESKLIFRVTLIIFVIIGFIGTAVMIFGSKFFAFAVASEPTYMCLIAISPTLFFICMSSSIRGYFQGHQNMIPTALSQLIEALGKLILGMIFARYAVAQGYDYPLIAAYAIAGLTVGSAVGLVFLMLSKLISDRREASIENGALLFDTSGTDETMRTWKQIGKELVKIAVPITMSASVISFTNLIDVMVVIRRLKSIGFDHSMAMTIYGNYTTLVVPMFNLPTALIYPISYSITPMISSALASGNEPDAKKIINNALKIAALITIPASLGMAAFAEPILKLFFKPASAEMAAPLLSVLAMSVFLVGMLTVINAVLQAYKYERKPIKAMIIGAAIKLVVSYVLIGVPEVGIYGTPIGTFLCYLTITVIDFYFLAKYVKVIPNIGKIFLKPFISAAVSVGIAMLTYKLSVNMLHNILSVVLSIFVAAVLYFVIILLMKGVSEDEIKLMPGGNHIFGFLHKLKLM